MICTVVNAVEIDMGARTLRFIVDGKDQGVAYSDLPTGVELSPAVSLYDVNDKVQYLP